MLFVYNVDTLNICTKEFGSEKIIFVKKASCENLYNFSLIRLLYISWVDQLLPQLMMEQFDSLPIQ